MNSYAVIGLMSGTSLDGVDIALCEFSKTRNRWNYKIKKAITVGYTAKWKHQLSVLELGTAFSLVQIHNKYGHFLGKLVRDFIRSNGIKKVDFVASHGHTVFHQPDNGITFQIGQGTAIAAECGLPVITDFRSLDVALGGQGAPLVPLGDKLLFPDYGYCLNLGGFANISYDKNGKRIAFDICPVNIVINTLCQSIGKDFDNKGLIAKKGKVDPALLKALNHIRFYLQKPPKSLGKEWVQNSFYPVLQVYQLPIQDQLRTIYEHIAVQIAKACTNKKDQTVLITGGGAYNVFLIERIQALTQHQVIIPDSKTIEFKEALIFAFLGVLRSRGEVNCLRSVTGAKYDNSGGAMTHK